MKKLLIYILVLLLALMFQVGFLPPLLGSFPQPNLLLMAVMLTAVQANENKDQPDLALTFAFISGIFLDLISSHPFGIFTVSFLILALGAHWVARIWFETGINYKNVAMILLTSAIVMPVVLEASSGETIAIITLFKSLLISAFFLLPLSFLYYVRTR